MAGSQVLVYTADYCPFCRRAKDLLRSKSVPFAEIDVEAEPGKRAEMMQRTGRRTIPQVFIGDHLVGGCDELYAAERSGELDRLLSAG